MIFATVSYRGDLDRLHLLRESMDVFYRGNAEHIIIVPREDFALFKPFAANPNVKVLIQNDLVDSIFYPRAWYNWTKKLLSDRAWRLAKYGGRPGWIIQQIVKLSLSDVTEEQDIVVIDSDVVFTRHFDDSDFVSEGGKHVLVRFDPGIESARHRKHMVSSRQLLNLSEGGSDHHYMSCPAVLNRDWLQSLRNYIDAAYAKPWQHVLFAAEVFSEYCLYGIYVEEVLKPQNILIRECPYNLGIWDADDFFGTLDDFLNSDSLSENYLCLTIQSNLGISAEEYEDRVRGFLFKQS